MNTKTRAPEFVKRQADWLQTAGYDVELNETAELVTVTARKGIKRISLQAALNRHTDNWRLCDGFFSYEGMNAMVLTTYNMISTVVSDEVIA
jgi:hypothetical protein